MAEELQVFSRYFAERYADDGFDHEGITIMSDLSGIKGIQTQMMRCTICDDSHKYFGQCNEKSSMKIIFVEANCQIERQPEKVFCLLNRQTLR